MTESRKTKINWGKQQEYLANQSDLAVVIVDDRSALSAANNNSICEVLNKSAEFTGQCAKFCGIAFAEATKAGGQISVKCHAGLHYNAVPIKSSENKQLVAIIGRTFLKSEDYLTATMRAIEGDWQKFPADELFKNVLLSSSETEITKLSKRFSKLTDDEKSALFQAYWATEISTDVIKPNPEVSQISQAEEISKMIERFESEQPKISFQTEKIDHKFSEELEEIAAWRSLFSSLLEMEYKEAIVSIAGFLSKRYQISNVTWLENRENVLESIWSTGSFTGQQIQISISAADSRFLDVVQRETSLELRERKTNANNDITQTFIHLFPMTVGGIVRNALVVGDELKDERIKKQVSRLVRQVATEIEILHLRDEIKEQAVMTRAVRKMNQTLKQIDNADFWSVLVQNAAELMRAERGSILILDEESEKFRVKGAIGNQSDVIKMIASKYLGERVARNVLRTGRPLIVKDAKKSGIPVAPADWQYKTNSFICYPIIISGKKIGVLNLTDKLDGSFYNEKDIEILHALTPQIALALDRTSLMRKAGEFEQLSITDSLTGLLNRRYLEERLTEELNRSQRHGYPMSFLMIDVDEFKPYNDNFGHTEGDKALQLVGQSLKSTLRGADVAARYGGEEFSILLPQTTLKEAHTIAERIRQKVEETRFPNRAVTISIGIATCSNELNNTEILIAAADKALYRAKKKGRNRVEIWGKNE